MHAKFQLGNISIHERIVLKWSQKQIGCEDKNCMSLVQDKGQSSTSVISEINLGSVSFPLCV